MVHCMIDCMVHCRIHCMVHCRIDCMVHCMVHCKRQMANNITLRQVARRTADLQAQSSELKAEAIELKAAAAREELQGTTCAALSLQPYSVVG
jgi:hypothetical protein